MVVKLSCGKGGENINEFDKDVIKRISDEHYKKILRHLKDIFSYDVHLKCHLKEGNIKRHDISIRVSSSKGNFEASAEDWELKNSLHKALEKLDNEIEHRTHASNQGNDFKRVQNTRRRK